MRISTVALVMSAGAIVVALIFFRDSGGGSDDPLRTLLQDNDRLAVALDTGELEIRNAHGTFRIGDRNGSWWMLEPISHPVAADVLDTIFGALPAVHTAPTDGSPSRDSLGFDTPRARLLVKTADRTALDLELGIDVAFEPYVYARVDGGRTLWKAPAELFDVLARDREGMRSRALVPLDRSEIGGIELVDATTHWKAERIGSGWQFTLPDSGALMYERIREILSTISSLEALEFLDGSEVDDLQESPHSTLRVYPRSGEAPI